MEAPRPLSEIEAEIKDLLQKADEAVARDPEVVRHYIKRGEYLHEARQHFADDAEFYEWIKRERFRDSPPNNRKRLSPKSIQQHIDKYLQWKKEWTEFLAWKKSRPS